VTGARRLNHDAFLYLRALRDDPELWSPGVDSPRPRGGTKPPLVRRCVVCGSWLEAGSAPSRRYCSKECGRPPVEVDRTWVESASCLGCDADLFYPARGESCREAKAVCAGCPVRVECLAYALATGEKLGIWGGTSERERRRLRQRRRLAGAA
jgi:WhiB family redox-sensing transcriptional regulator